MMRSLPLLAAVLLWIEAGWGEAAPCVPADTLRPRPMEFLRANDARAKALLARAPKDSIPAALRDSLRDQINRVFDFETLSKLALGDYWDQRTPEEKAHFVATFGEIIREQNFDSFVRYYREGDIQYKSESVHGDTARVVAVVPLRDDQIEIQYALHAADHTWRVYDLVVDGVSTAAGNRRRYARYIEKHSYQQLITQLDKQLAKLHQEKP